MHDMAVMDFLKLLCHHLKIKWFKETLVEILLESNIE